MKKTILLSTILLILGIFICLVALAQCDFDFSKLTTSRFKTSTYQVVQDFDKISIDVNTTDIEFILSDDFECSVECREEEKIKHSVRVENKTLLIEVKDTRKWYEHIGINFESEKITVYLPQNEYTSLIILNNTGDIDIPKDFTFGKIKIDADTSDVNCSASLLNDISIKVSTGDVTLNGSRVENKIEVNTATGKIKLTDIKCQNLELESNTGDIKLNECDADEISIETDTGDVFGSLISDKIFIVESDTGNIDVPETTSGGICKITTDTGDIKIEIEKGSDGFEKV